MGSFEALNVNVAASLTVAQDKQMRVKTKQRIIFVGLPAFSQRRNTGVAAFAVPLALG